MRVATKRINRVLAAGLCAIATGCSGGGAGVGTSQSRVLTAQSPKTTEGNVTFAIAIKPKTKPARIAPKYISPSTQSLQIVTDGVNPAVVNLTTPSRNCLPNPVAPGSYVCRASLKVPAGNHVFTVTTYDLTDAKGNVLSTNHTGTVYVKPTGATTISMVLEGAVRFVILALATTNPPVGTAATISLTAILEDADQNLIVGPAPYEYPVTLTTTNAASGALSKTALKFPADASGITTNYNGAKVASITYSATAPELASANVINAVLTPGHPSIVEFTVPTSDGGPTGITVGPDGNLWFTEINSNSIGKVTTSGIFTEYSVPTSDSQPSNITAGPDGNLWFTESAGYKIGKLTSSGTFTEYAVPTSDGSPSNITAGPDGNLWFTDTSSNTIGKMTTSGALTEYIDPTSGSGTAGITAGPDGNLWFTSNFGDAIGKVTTSGTFTVYHTPTKASSPWNITRGPDGNLWFTEFSGNKIGKVTTTGAFTEYSGYSGLPGFEEPLDITAGPDGSLWFTELIGNKIGKATTAGAVTEYSLPTSFSYPESITSGPDGNVWFTEYSNNRIGKLVL